MENIKLLPNFTQVCVWPGIIIKENEIPEVIEWFENQFDVRIQYLETIVTLPDKSENGNDIPETGGRHDAFIAIHNDDIDKFTIPRFSIGVRWIEDVLNNHNYTSPIYPERVFEYKSWDGDVNEEEVNHLLN
jgi:hypothetical protein